MSMPANPEEKCKVTQTLDVVTRLSHIVKRGLLKQRIYGATWSVIVFMAIQFYLASTMSMATNIQLMLGVGVIYFLWVGSAYFAIIKLDAEYAKKLHQIETSV